jgi:hypothetical protein
MLITPQYQAPVKPGSMDLSFINKPQTPTPDPYGDDSTDGGGAETYAYKLGFAAGSMSKKSELDPSVNEVSKDLPRLQNFENPYHKVIQPHLYNEFEAGFEKGVTA